MTNPTHAQNVPGKGRWYVHPVTGESWPSVTNVLDVSVAKPALVPWAAKITAAKAWDLLPRMVATSRHGQDARDELSREIKGEVRIAKDMAADLGSRIHHIIDCRHKGITPPDDPEAAPFVGQAFRFFAEFGVDLDTDIEAAEATVVNRTAGYAGTGDLWLWVRLGGKRVLLLVDYKSSSTRPVMSVYPEQGMQVAALAHAEKFLLDTGEEIDPPGPVHGCALLNLRPRDYALIPMPLDRDLDAAFTAFRGALANATYLHSQHGLKPTKAEPDTTDLPKAG